MIVELTTCLLMSDDNVKIVNILKRVIIVD